MNEDQIINTALERLTQQTGLKAKWKPRHDEIDGEVDFYFQKGNLHVFAEIKKELRLHQLDKYLSWRSNISPLW